jgi:succinate-acetate transporter protein
MVEASLCARADSELISPVFTFFGGMLQIIGGTGEWILGNTFSSVLFFTYGKCIAISVLDNIVTRLPLQVFSTR